MKKSKIIKQYQSPHLGTIDVIEYPATGERQLKTGECIHGLSINRPKIEKSYWYAVAQHALNHAQTKQNPHLLMLGLGANTTTGLISKLNPTIHQTIVDIDQQVIEACKEFFGLQDQPNTTVVEADIYQLIENPQAFNQQFEVIIVDVFIGEDPYLSTDTGQPSFIQKVLTWLKPDGMIIFNRPANTDEGQAEGKQLQQYLQTLFEKVELEYIKDPAPYYFHNYIITAVNKKH